MPSFISQSSGIEFHPLSFHKYNDLFHFFFFFRCYFMVEYVCVDGCSDNTVSSYYALRSFYLSGEWSRLLLEKLQHYPIIVGNYRFVGLFLQKCKFASVFLPSSYRYAVAALIVAWTKVWVNKHRQVFRVQRFFLSFSRHIIIAIIMPDFFSFLSLDGRSFVSFLFPGIEFRKWEISGKEERGKK